MIYFLQHCWDINTSYFFFRGKSSQVLWAKQQTCFVGRWCSLKPDQPRSWKDRQLLRSEWDLNSGSSCWLDIIVNSTCAWYYNLFSSICKKNKSINHCWSLRALGVSNRQNYPLDRQPTRLRLWATQGFQYLLMVLTIHWKETSLLDKKKMGVKHWHNSMKMNLE